jgi:hypothetical protein
MTWRGQRARAEVIRISVHLSGELFMAVDIGVPLTAIGAVLIALVLDDQLVRQIDEVDAPHRALIVARQPDGTAE